MSMDGPGSPQEAEASRSVDVQQVSQQTDPGNAERDQETAVAGTRPRLASTSSAASQLSELKRFTLWETRTHFYMIAYNTSQTLFRILKIDRLPGTNAVRSTDREESVKRLDDTSAEAVRQGKPDWTLNVVADRVVYTRGQVTELLDMISEGNKSAGGLKEVGRFFGVIGFIRFTSTYYMVLISRRSVVGLLGGHYIYHCDETKIIPICPASVLANIGGRTKTLEQDEMRLLHTFKQVDLSKNFYFSYTYDLTKTLQDNLTRVERKDNVVHHDESLSWGYNEKFLWNHHLLLPAFAATERVGGQEPANEWVLPLIHGFVDQAKLRVLNCTIYVTLIARRSRHFAGARFLKRGIDEKGHVANDVETEQIVSDALTSPFYAPAKGSKDIAMGAPARMANPRYTAYVMSRGSIPVYWTQDSTNLSPRPPIEISVVDPFYSAAGLHFDDMFRRYGYPIVILNLIKSKERQPREVKLLNAFNECVRYLNQFLPNDKRLRYIAWDMSRASKSRDQDVIGVLEDIAEETLEATNFFHSGPEPSRLPFDADGQRTSSRTSILLQSGVARVNCVDCLDRTNAAQFVIGKAAFGHQLYALGLLDHPKLPFDSDAIDMLTEMYHDLGDTVALQYGGSQLVNTMETYRKINQWTSHSRDMLQGLKRYYSNSFVDAEKQMAINLFLGVANDAPEFRPVNISAHRHYQRWFTTQHLADNSKEIEERQRALQCFATQTSSFWAEYYRPSLFTDLMRHHAFKMTAIHQHSAALSRTTIQMPGSPVSSSASVGSSSPKIDVSPKRTRRASAASSVHPSSVLISPFTSRLPPSSPTKGGTGDTPDRQARAGSQHQQRALIGGVRRWMSLNRGEQNLKSEEEATQPDLMERKSSSSHVLEVKSTVQSISAWPTWDEITGTNTLAPATEALLKRYMSPEVSKDEANEYTSWLEQFKEVDFDAGSDYSVPPPAALLPAGHMLNASEHTDAHRARQSQVPMAPNQHHGRYSLGDGVGASSLTPSSVLAPQQLYPIATRTPITQKQRQQIAEADAQLYQRHVSLANGHYDSLDRTELNDEGHRPLAHAPSRNAIETSLLQYPLTSSALHAPASDAKVRAFTRWLNGHHQSLAVLT